MLCLIIPNALQAQLGVPPGRFTHADTLRGSNGPYRAWWDVTHYDVSVRPDLATRSIQGKTVITFRAVSDGQRMQIDLQQPLEVRSITASLDGPAVDVHFNRDGQVIWVELPSVLHTGGMAQLTIRYEGIPRAARNPPWDGGWIWKTAPDGSPWMSLACQGLGASVWYPCKDIQSDEPDSAALHITVPDSLQAVGNGRLRSASGNGDGTTTWHWAVTNPINSYNLVPYIGPYVHFGEEYAGEDGPLSLDYWVLNTNETKAREQFKQVPLMLACFEERFGPYPFYSDGYKLVEAPYLGMEHQSDIAYGNQFRNGYLGHDLSGSGWGLKWDYIIIHESAHEWFGNNITTADIADMWVHEGFACYAEAIYTECRFGKAAGEEYVIGLRQGISNDRPIIGDRGVNSEGSNDQYPKGANMIHTIRHIMANDSLFFAMLHEMNLKFRHSTTTSAEVEVFISSFSGIDVSKLFDQYLRTTQVPELQWTINKDDLYVRFTHCVPGLSMPVNIQVNGEERRVPITEQWSSPASGLNAKTVEFGADANWYLGTERVNKKMLKARSGE